MAKRVPLQEAMETAKRNRVGRMVGRGRDNRIEPECWPQVTPGFTFTKDQKFFAIGSCFATNISKHLALDGYNVHGFDASVGDRRNRYTPAAIYQELAWAGAIYHRDDQVGDEDVLPLLLELGPGKWTDLWSRPGKLGPTSLEQAIAARKQLYAFFRGAFEADVVIITLGLIEAWWDEVSGSYVEFDTAWTRRADRDRFQFERLTFEQSKCFAERTLSLLLDGRRRILLTTSPVSLGRTFTDRDIIIANSHSKAVLRAVCGELSEAHEGVDYFPSYEIATLTRQPEVWEDDLVHVQANFIARIMQHVTSAYVPGSIGSDDRALMRIANLVEALQFDAARQLYREAGEAIWRSSSAAVHVAAMRLAVTFGDTDLAVRHALRVDLADERLYQSHPEWMFDISRLLAVSDGRQDEGERIRRRIVTVCTDRPELFQQMFAERQRAGDDAALRALIPLILEADVSYPMLMHKVCAKLNELGEAEEALRLADRQLSRTPDDELMLARKARQLLVLKRPAAAVEPLRRLAEREPDNGWAHVTLARTLHKVGRTAEAVEALDKLSGEGPADADGLALKARLLWKLRRREEAVEVAERAAAAAAGDPAVLRDLQPLLAGSLHSR